LEIESRGFEGKGRNVKVYVADFDFGFIAEHNLEGELQMTLSDWDDYYSCWDVEGNFIERNVERGKANFFRKSP
jgi:hypothetical protein